MPTPNFRPIATTLASAIWRYATLGALLIGLLQAGVSYVHVHEEFEEQVRDIARSNLALLSIAIWDIEPEVVQRQINTLIEKPQIGYVQLTVSTGQVFAAGERSLASSQHARQFAVPSPGSGQSVIGELAVYENPQAFYRELLYVVGTALIGYGLLTLTICALIIYLLKRALERPLRHIAHFVVELTPDRLVQPLLLERPERGWRDEIDLVVDGFRTLQSGLRGYIANLDEMVAQRTAELNEAMASIQRLSMTDSLTGCFNRRLFNERIVQELERAERYGRPLSLIFCDIDYFKRVNDQHGHLVGDQVLQAVSASFTRNLRSEVDWVARYGGEEFVLVLPETALAEAIATAERLRLVIECEVSVAALPALRVTASFGVAQFVPADTPVSLLQRADEMVYQAKAEGRNRTCPTPDPKLPGNP
jgi:diguanylate cyclase (GGDEF)-like protein